MTAPWPAHGSLNWDASLFAYVSGPGQNPITGMFHADAYGDFALKTSNVNLAIAAVQATGAGGVVYMKAGQWTCDEPINMSSAGELVKLRGAGQSMTRVVISSASSYGFLEIVGSPKAQVEGIGFTMTAGTFTAQYGILAGRAASNASVDGLKLKDVYVYGRFTIAAMVSVAAEQAHYEDCIFYSDQGAGLVLARDVRNWAVTARWTAVTSTTPLSSGNGILRLDSVQCWTTRLLATGPTDYPLVVEFAQTFTADGLYTVSAGPPLILLDKRIDQASFRGLKQEWIAGGAEPVGVYLKNTPTSGELNNMRLSFDASSLYSILSEDNVKLNQLSVRGSGWRSSTKTWTVDLYESDTVDLPSGNSWSVIGDEDTTPTYRKRNSTSLVVALPHSILRATANLDFPSVAASGGTQILTVTVTGAATGDDATVHWDSLGAPAALISDAWVSAANTVTVRVTNVSLAAINPAIATVRVNVFKFA
jgi:hypothetical protein